MIQTCRQDRQSNTGRQQLCRYCESDTEIGEPESTTASKSSLNGATINGTTGRHTRDPSEGLAHQGRGGRRTTRPLSLRKADEQRLIVRGQVHTHRIRIGRPPPCRPLDVSEQKRHRSSRLLNPTPSGKSVSSVQFVDRSTIASPHVRPDPDAGPVRLMPMRHCLGLRRARHGSRLLLLCDRG